MAGLWLAAALLVIIGGAMLKKESEKTPEQIAPYEAAATRYAKKPHILTPPEYNLYMLLRDLYGGKYEILAQTSLVSLVDKLNYNSYRNELFRIVDFVIADKEFSPLVVIELNDSSHLRADRRERDRKGRSSARDFFYRRGGVVRCGTAGVVALFALNMHKNLVIGSYFA